MSQPHNILWICSDSQRWDTLGCYGNSLVRTPNLDRLASQGVRFEQAFAQNPLCMPSRGSFLTGRYPVTNRLRQNGQTVPPDLLPVTKLLADAGYVCGLIGKLHLNACDYRLTLGPNWFQQDRRLWFHGGEKRLADDGYSVFHWDHAPTGEYPASDYTRWLLEHGYSREPRTTREDTNFIQNGRPTEQHQSFWCAEKAIGFIRAFADDPHPWLLSVNLFDPHYAFDPPAEWLEPYLDRLGEIPLPNFVPGELENKPSVQTEKHTAGKYVWSGMSEKDHRLIRAAYWAMCDLLDAQIGRILQAVDESGQRENTVIVFMSDHGEMLGDHGLYLKGPFLYEGALRVPLIIAGPQVASGVTVNGLVELADLAPTVLEMAGLPRHPGMQTRSLVPLLTGKSEETRRDVYSEYYNSNPDKPGQFLTMVRTETHKLIRHHRTQTGELYDLTNDPTENINRWNDPAYATVKSELLLALSDRMAETCDPLPERVGVF
ncbi:MAG: sulfatase-like hydrolase/transferase [Armatimonadaceae bacterium]